MATPIPQNEAVFSLSAVMACTGGRLTGHVADDALEIRGVSSDTRQVRQGQAFIALSGERFDGHDHLAAAAEAGAVLAIVERTVEAPAGLTLLVVADTLAALGALGRYHLMRWRADGQRRVLALTGSAGKTTTKAAIASLLEAVRPGQVLSAPGNLNNLVGVPMVALTLGDDHRYAVLELGTNAPGEIGKLARIAQPDVGLITLIAAAHTEGLGGIDGVAREKGALFSELSESGVAMGNADDERVAAALARCAAGRKVSYGEREGAGYRIVSRRLVGSTSQLLVIEADRHIEVETTLLGRTGALATTAAIAAVEALTGEPLDPTIVKQALIGIGGRMRPREAGPVLVIDDSYNSNPASARASIEAAAEIAVQQERPLVLVLGEMRELGALSAAEHEALGEVVAQSGARLLIAVGGDAQHIARRAGQIVTHFVETSDEAAALARRDVEAGDVVLVKGSRGVRTERVVDALCSAGGGA